MLRMTAPGRGSAQAAGWRTLPLALWYQFWYEM